MKTMHALILAAGMASVEASAQTHRLKQDEPATGSMIRRDTSYSNVSFNKSYEDLSPEEKRIVRAAYEQLAEDDEPPYPLKGTAIFSRSLQQILRALRDNEEGVLDMAVMVDSEGKGTSVRIFQSPSPELARAMAGVLMLERYKPALCHGQPCAQEYPLKMRITRRR